MDIDKVFIINLKERTDRRKEILKELNNAKIDNYEFFDAIRPTIEDLNKWNPNYIETIPGWFKRLDKDEQKYRLGQLGCLLSHYNVIKECKKRGYQNVLILEDDTKFMLDSDNLNSNSNTLNFTDKLMGYREQLEKIKNIYGVLYLTGNHRSESLKRISENILNVRYTLTTGSYIISNRGIDYILDNIEGYDREVDIFYAEILQQKLPCFCIYPHIAGQAESYSDIVQMNVNYKL